MRLSIIKKNRSSSLIKFREVSALDFTKWVGFILATLVLSVKVERKESMGHLGACRADMPH